MCMVRHLSLILAAVILSGCASKSYREDSSPPETTLLTVYQTQVAVGDCTFRPKPEAAVLGLIASALLTSAVSQGVNYVGKAIEEAAKETTDRATATRNVEVTASSFGPCIQIVRGWFYRGFENDAENRRLFAEAEESWADQAEGRAIDASILTLLWQRRMWLSAQPDFIFEAEIVPSSSENRSDNQVLALAPVYARLNQPISTAWLRPSKTREVAVFIGFSDAGQDPGVPSGASGGMALGRLAHAVDMQFPPPPRETNLTPNRGADESRWFKLAVGESKKPMTITALVTEHREAKAFLQFIADVFTGAKPSIASTLQNAVVPSLREQAEETETSKDEAARNSYEDALAKALTAATTCAAGVTDPVAAANEVRSKVRSLNKAARGVDDGSEFAEDSVPLSIDVTKVQGGCVALRDQLRTSLP